MKKTAYDLSKTQFLVREGFYGLRPFRRKRGMMLFNKDGSPARPITWEEWTKLKKDWPDEVKQDGLTVRTVWFLVEIEDRPR